MRRAIVAAGLLMATLPFVLGGEPRPAKPTIEQVIAMLHDEEFEVRRTAEEAIGAMGPAALPALRKALEAKPPLDVSRRIQRWISRFELAELSDPKFITINVTDRPLQEVIDQIAKQSGYKIDFVEAFDKDREKKPYSFRFERVTFWEALDAVCTAAEMLPSPNPDGKGFHVRFSDQHQPFVYRHGAFRVVADELLYQYEYSRSWRTQLNMVPRKTAEKQHADVVEHEFFCFNMCVEAEPRLRLFDHGPIMLSEASDDQKNNLLLAEGAQRAYGFFVKGRPSIRELHTAYLKAPAKGARKVAILKGTIPVHLEKEKKTIVLTDKLLEAKGKKFEFGKITMVIDKVEERADRRYDLYLTLTGEAAEPGLKGELKLLDEKGKRYAEARFFRNGETAVCLGFRAPHGSAIGPAVKLVCTTHVTQEYVLPFEFRDLPLP